jgi:hypothetical protein
MRIFLSYGHDEHIALALRMKSDLERQGHEVFTCTTNVDEAVRLSPRAPLGTVSEVAA